jgi:Tfp pilus assembly protein PilF
MQQLLSDVCSTPDSSAALAFLARVLKANGAVHQALQLYRKAVRLHPDNSSYALELAHTLELDHDYAAVLQVLLGYCEACEGKSMGPLQLKVRELLATGLKHSMAEHVVLTAKAGRGHTCMELYQSVGADL